MPFARLRKKPHHLYAHFLFNFEKKQAHFS